VDKEELDLLLSDLKEDPTDEDTYWRGIERLGRSWQNDVDELRRSSVMAAQAGESELAGLIAEEADSRGAAHREIVATLLEQGPPGLGAPEPTSSRSAACPFRSPFVLALRSSGGGPVAGDSDDRSTGIRNP
jgi:hypothetical protein